MMKKMHLRALLAFLLLHVSSVMAEKAYPVITYTCDPENDVLKIKNEIKWGEEAKSFPYSVQQGTYNPWDWVIVKKQAGKSRLMQNKTVELSCQLSTNIYKVILKPKIFKADYLTRCGDRISAKVTIFRGGSVLLEDKELEPFCLGNAPIIRGIKVLGKTGKLKLYKIAKYKFY